MQHFTEADLEALGRKGAVEAIRSFLRDTGEGKTSAPPRVRVPVLGRDLVFTVGGSAAEDIAGFRLYSIGEKPASTGGPGQLVVLIRLSTGEVLATAEGSAFGAWRTAAIGAVAMDEATKHIDGPIEVAVLGAGFQASHHLPTWLETRTISRVRVWARRRRQAIDLVALYTLLLNGLRGLVPDVLPEVIDARSAESAVQGAQAVLAVTSSPEPIVDAGAIREDAYLATVGPKFGGRHELPEELYASAATLFSDAPEQCAQFEEARGPLPGGRRAEEMIALADVVCGNAELPTSGRRLFVSEGLAGSEVALLGALWEASS